jgi:hypothetical protein
MRIKTGEILHDATSEPRDVSFFLGSGRGARNSWVTAHTPSDP